MADPFTDVDAAPPEVVAQITAALETRGADPAMMADAAAMVSEVYAPDFVDINFHITDATTGEPVQGQSPGAWMDMGETIYGQQDGVSTSRERAGLYLRGLVGIRPMIDLNSYYVLVMNDDFRTYQERIVKMSGE